MRPGMGLVATLVSFSVVAASPGWLVVAGDAEQSSIFAASAVAKALVKSGRTADVLASTHAAAQCSQLAGAEQAPCYAAATAGARVLVVNGVVLRDRFALTIAVLAKNGAVLEEAGDKGAVDEVDALAERTLSGLARSLNAREASDAPVVTKLVPPQKEREEVVLPQAPAPSRAPAWIATGVTAVAAGVAVTFLVMGLSQKSTLEAAQPGALRHSDATAQANQANLDLSVALGAGLGAAATGTLAGVLWGAKP
jgi:hypothetical protein